MSPNPDPVQLLRALAHPIRLELLLVSAHRDISPAQFARRLGEPVANVTYHFRRLEQVGCIEMVRRRPVRGTVEHFYRGVFASALQLPAGSGRYFAVLPIRFDQEGLEDLQGIVLSLERRHQRPCRLDLRSPRRDTLSI
ncbi:MAG: ArsR/SmtB family transcription factor [Solirubrobacterales bacterium]